MSATREHRGIASYRDIQNARFTPAPIPSTEPRPGSLALGIVLIIGFFVGAIEINDGAKRGATIERAANSCMAQGRGFYVAHVEDVDQVVCTRGR